MDGSLFSVRPGVERIVAKALFERSYRNPSLPSAKYPIESYVCSYLEMVAGFRP